MNLNRVFLINFFNCSNLKSWEKKRGKKHKNRISIENKLRINLDEVDSKFLRELMKEYLENSL